MYNECEPLTVLVCVHIDIIIIKGNKILTSIRHLINTFS